MQYFGNVRHSSIASNPFAKITKGMNHTGLWDASSTDTLLSTTCQICLGVRLQNPRFRSSSSCLIVKTFWTIWLLPTYQYTSYYILPTTTGTFCGLNCFSHMIYASQIQIHKNIAKFFLLVFQIWKLNFTYLKKEKIIVNQKYIGYIQHVYKSNIHLKP